jgi:phosphatidylinositol-3-phosphatase
MVLTVTGVTRPVSSKAFAVFALLGVLAAAVTAVVTAGRAAADVTFVQGKGFDDSGTSPSVPVSLSRPVGAGDLLVGWFAQYGAAGRVRVSDNINGAWTRAPGREQFGGVRGDIALYYLAGSKAAASGLTITVSAASGADFQGSAAEYSGAGTSSPLSAMAVSRGSGTTVDTGATSPVPSGQLVYAAEVTGVSPGAAATPGSSHGMAYTGRSGTASGSAFEEDITSAAAGAQTGHARLPGATDWYAVVAAFAPGPASSPAAGRMTSAGPVRTGATGARRGPGQAPTATAGPAAAASSGISKILIISDENHSDVDVFPAGSGSAAAMPYLWSLAQEYGYATSWSDIGHPSLPNYLAMFGGSAEGLPDDCSPGPGCSWPGPTVFSQAIAAGGTAKVYAEGMTANCQASNPGSYDANHNPWVYYRDTADAAECRADDVPAGTPGGGALRSDITSGSLPTAGLLKPDLANDGTDGTLATADRWLRTWIPVIQSGPDWQAGRLAVVVTFDESDEGAGRENVPFVLIAPGVSGTVVTAALNHYALTRLLDEVAGVPLLGEAGTEPDIAPLFGVRLRASSHAGPHSRPGVPDG